MLVVSLAAWGWTLNKLQRDTKESKKLLPNQRLFLLHRNLLVAFTVLVGVNYFVAWLASNTNTTSNAFYVWAGLSYLTMMLADLVESAIFYLVVSLMLPITEDQKKKSENVEKIFLFGCFIDPTQLEKAMYAQHPDLNEIEKDSIHEDIEKILALVRPSGNTNAIIGGMVEVQEVTNIEDTAYWGYVKMRIQRAKTFDSFHGYEETEQSLKLIDSVPMLPLMTSTSEFDQVEDTMSSFQSEDIYTRQSLNSYRI